MHLDHPLAPGRHRVALGIAPLLMALTSCTSIGSLMSPYSEKFSCKNSDHGQCIDPEQAYQDAVAGRKSRSAPAVTNDRSLLKDRRKSAKPAVASAESVSRSRGARRLGAFAGYRDSVYRELQGLIDAPVTPMLKTPQTVRTLILPYADRQRPDRLYMPRYVYSVLEAPSWVVGGYLVNPASPAGRAPVLGQVHEPAGAEPATANQENQP
jgi:conjugal transfer pilus assembly protein TraV